MTTLPSRIPATIVTGFLGAGKTTLIRRLLERADGKRIAVIVNEFGDLGFDGSLIGECVDPDCVADDVIELTNGCICCTVADDFLPTIEALLDRPNPPEHVVIETSGLALPQPLVSAFAWPTVKTRITVDGVVTLVDAHALSEGRLAADLAAVEARRKADPALDHESPIEELFEDQLTCADVVVLTKTDLVDGAALDGVRGQVSGRIRAGVPTVEGRAGEVPVDALFGIVANAEDDVAARAGHHGVDHDHEHDDFDSFVLTPGSFASVGAARHLVTRIVERDDVLRVKGRLAVDGKPAPLVVQAVGPRVETWFGRPGDAVGGIVVIGIHDMDRAAVEALVAELPASA
ncbi:cobalamin biosynthesis protein CobW [Amorphus coralli]|uniref:cobalamin biosynthesis protein CobW n=1 Tax=Amorphus coralli TaxID=340680 RepID=UPI000376BB9E|nr:cobalamin biosynthesis protein CobW [Amorphus coralli]